MTTIEDLSPLMWESAIERARKGESAALVELLKGETALDAESRVLLARYIEFTRRPKRAGRPKKLTRPAERYVCQMYRAATTGFDGYPRRGKTAVLHELADAMGVSVATVEKVIRKNMRGFYGRS